MPNTAFLKQKSINSSADMMRTTNVGTPLWMAPEIMQGWTTKTLVPYTLSVDVYSFGIVLWEIAAQRLPWQDVKKGLFTLFTAILSGQRPAIDVAWPVAYSELMSLCWALEPSHRPPFKDALAELDDLAARLADNGFRALSHKSTLETPI